MTHAELFLHQDPNTFHMNQRGRSTGINGPRVQCWSTVLRGEELDLVYQCDTCDFEYLTKVLSKGFDFSTATSDAYYVQVFKSVWYELLI